MLLGHWFTADGGVVAQVVTRMSITTEIAPLSAVPHLIAAAAGMDKAEVFTRVARSGLITGLVTDREAAEWMLQLTVAR